MGSGGERELPEAGSASASGNRYAIRVEGHLGNHRSEWLGGMTITLEGDGITRLNGPVVDQAALHGLLTKLGDLRLTIISVERLGDVEIQAPSPEELPENTA